MKTNHDSDPLDQKIDALLASRPLQASDDFAARVMAATEPDANSSQSTKRPFGKLIAFALPLAAAIAVAFSLLQLEPENTAGATALSTAEAQEIFLLEESLSSLAAIGSTDFATDDLIDTLDALYLEI